MPKRRRSILTTLLACAAMFGTGCILEKKVTTSWTMTTCEDIPANWDAPYYSWNLYQPLMIPAFGLKAKLTFKTPKGMGQPPTGFTWRIEHRDGIGGLKGTQEVPGAIKVKKYKGTSKFNVTLPGWDLAPDDQLQVYGSFNGYVPANTVISAKLKYAF